MLHEDVSPRKMLFWLIDVYTMQPWGIIYILNSNHKTHIIIMDTS